MVITGTPEEFIRASAFLVALVTKLQLKGLLTEADIAEIYQQATLLSDEEISDPPK